MALKFKIQSLENRKQLLQGSAISMKHSLSFHHLFG